MLEWLVTIGTAELGKAIFEQVLKLGQAAAEDYVKDFFKGGLKDGIAAAKPEVAKKAVAEALKAFLLLVTDELEDQDLSKAEIRDRYDPALVQFVQNQAVKPILGKAFEKDCRAIDATALASLWQQSACKGKAFPALPAAFDWQRIGNEYLKKVRRLIRETPELRSLLETELLEDLVRNTTQLSPGFDVAQYRHSLQCSYGHLKLYAIDSTDRVDAIKLWTMFIEQTVREALPPTRYELPLDLRQTSEFSKNSEVLMQQDYFQQPSQKILAAVADAQLAVILGDPGAGKSTLLQYLALNWAESQTSEVFKTSEVSRLPLLIELREYAIAQTHNFLEFLHRGRGVDWQFDQQQLHQHLQDHPTLVMFDGLDEVFDRATQSTIIDDIIRFAQQYPNAQILITSRIIGYNPERLQHANFRHFTIQPLNTEEMHEFIDRWYDLSMGSDPDKERLKQRLKDAIAHSKAIQNLADNPLLLTMMAILNRRQELPRDRADLYDQASRVLLYHWDVDHKRLHIPMDAIGRREKQEMLRLIAYDMQAGEEGLKGNLISSDRLTRILTDYLRDQGFSEPREKANLLIQQLRERNFILCYRGADTYGFMHRTFLEYFCAMEIVHRFEKQRTLTFEQLRDEVFGAHWQDETWHEVLRLICGAIDPQFAGILIEFLMSINSKLKDIKSLLLCCDFLLEIGNQSSIQPIAIRLIKAMRILVEEKDNKVSSDDYFKMISSLTQISQYEPDFLEFFQKYIQSRNVGFYPDPVMKVISQNFYDDLSVLSWLKAYAKVDQNWSVQSAMLQGLALAWKDDPETFSLIQSCLESNSGARWVKRVAAWLLADFFQENTETLPLLKDCLTHEQYEKRGAALGGIAKGYKNDPETLFTLEFCTRSDNHEWVRAVALFEISEGWKDEPKVFDLLCEVSQNDPFTKKEDQQNNPNPRQSALQALLTHYPTHPKTIELLRDRTANDPDEQLRQWAGEQLNQMSSGE